jgi:hypothetical protein
VTVAVEEERTKQRASTRELLAFADLPFAAQRVGHFGVGNNPTSVCIREASLDGLEYVQVVEDLVEGTVLGKAIK